jgi:hypothetical protein
MPDDIEFLPLNTNQSQELHAQNSSSREFLFRALGISPEQLRPEPPGNNPFKITSELRIGGRSFGKTEAIKGWIEKGRVSVERPKKISRYRAMDLDDDPPDPDAFTLKYMVPVQVDGKKGYVMSTLSPQQLMKPKHRTMDL